MKLFSSKASFSSGDGGTTTPLYNVEDIEIRNWTVDDFAFWLQQKNYKKKIIKILKKEGWNGDSLMELKTEMISKVPSGISKSIFNDIQQLKIRQSEKVKIVENNGCINNSVTTSTSCESSIQRLNQENQE
ncbi:hypothetical protein ABK040_011980 [Willaertia magna]